MLRASDSDSDSDPDPEEEVQEEEGSGGRRAKSKSRSRSRDGSLGDPHAELGRQLVEMFRGSTGSAPTGWHAGQAAALTKRLASKGASLGKQKTAFGRYLASNGFWAEKGWPLEGFENDFDGWTKDEQAVAGPGDASHAAWLADAPGCIRPPEER